MDGKNLKYVTMDNPPPSFQNGRRYTDCKGEGESLIYSRSPVKTVHYGGFCDRK